MHPSQTLHRLAHGLAAVALLTLLAFSPALRAQQPTASQGTHLVSPDQLQQQLETTTTTRQQNIDNLNRFFSTPLAQKAMKDAKIDPVQVRTAIPTLSDAELADLSARATHAQNDFSAGLLGIGTMLLIILVLVIIIVVAVVH